MFFWYDAEQTGLPVVISRLHTITCCPMRLKVAFIFFKKSLSVFVQHIYGFRNWVNKNPLKQNIVCMWATFRPFHWSSSGLLACLNLVTWFCIKRRVSAVSVLQLFVTCKRTYCFRDELESRWISQAVIIVMLSKSTCTFSANMTEWIVDFPFDWTDWCFFIQLDFTLCSWPSLLSWCRWR